jgi:hypothetical protein
MNAYSIGGVPTDMAIPLATPALGKSTFLIGSAIGVKLQRTCEKTTAGRKERMTKIDRVIVNICRRKNKRRTCYALTADFGWNVKNECNLLTLKLKWLYYLLSSYKDPPSH